MINKATVISKKNAYEDLANAIIFQATMDYRRALRSQQNSWQGQCSSADQAMIELERFFRSRWFGVLTTADPEILIWRIKKEVWDE